MVDLIMLLSPAAVTYLIANVLFRRKGRCNDVIASLSELVFYAGLNMGVLWHLGKLKNDTATMISVTENGYLDHLGMSFWFSLGVGAVIGILAGILKQLHFELSVEKSEHGFWNRLTKKARRRILLTGVGIAVILSCGAVARQQLEKKSMAKAKEACVETSAEILEELNKIIEKSLDEGMAVSELETFSVGELQVKRVIKDQYWKEGTGSRKEEAAYMVDNTGRVVYLTYRNQYYTATWSGPSEDQQFLDSHNGWNGGNGHGWSGTGIN